MSYESNDYDRYCGLSIPSADNPRCGECGDRPIICPACNGSGEGITESRCASCKGSGEIPCPECEARDEQY